MTNSPSNSQSRSRSRELAHTAGRGGVGNAYIGGPTEKVIEEVDESERAAHQHLAGMCVFFFSLFQNADQLTTDLIVILFQVLLWQGRRREPYGW
jgi:hypothetical protein